MGLTVCVGTPKDVEDVIRERYASDFRLINQLLKAEGVAAHKERVPSRDWWSAEMSYGSLHFLRRFAAGVAVNGVPPEPLKKNANAAAAPEIQTYWEKREANEIGAKYDHLIFHSDAEGYYVPVDFPDVLNCDSAVPLPGDWLGSAIRLKHECADLATRLGLLPTIDFDPDDDNAWKQLKKTTRGAVWHKYPIEAFVCATLLLVCDRSEEYRSAIVFG